MFNKTTFIAYCARGCGRLRQRSRARAGRTRRNRHHCDAHTGGARCGRRAGDRHHAPGHRTFDGHRHQRNPAGPRRASRSPATAARDRPLHCSRAAPTATTPWCSSTACASIPAPSAAPRLQNIAPESIERIEIVKGPRSSLYGTDAIGGVVQLFTRGATKTGRRERRRHLRQPEHAAVLWRCGDVGGRQLPRRASAAATPKATACRPS